MTKLLTRWTLVEFDGCWLTYGPRLPPVVHEFDAHSRVQFMAKKTELEGRDMLDGHTERVPIANTEPYRGRKYS